MKITSSSVLSSYNATVLTQISEVVRNYQNSSDKCWLREEITIIKACHSCSDRPECINTSFVETIECKFSGLVYRK